MAMMFFTFNFWLIFGVSYYFAAVSLVSSQNDETLKVLKSKKLSELQAILSKVLDTVNETEEVTTRDPRLTGDPRKDYVFDPNLPRELGDHNLSTYPFYSEIPKDITFKCDGKIDGYYASVPHHCQLFHLCVFGHRHDFLCANYTVFDQSQFICHFVNAVNCSNSLKHYFRNTEISDERNSITKKTTEEPGEDYEDYPERPRRRRPKNRRRQGNRRRTTTTTANPEEYYYDYEEEVAEGVPVVAEEEKVPTTTTERVRRPVIRPPRPILRTTTTTSEPIVEEELEVPQRPVHRTTNIAPDVEDEPQVPSRPVHRTTNIAPSDEEELAVPPRPVLRTIKATPSVVKDEESPVPVRPVHRTIKTAPSVEEEPEIPVRAVFRATRPVPSVVNDEELPVPVRPVHRTIKTAPSVEEEPEVPVRPVFRATKPAPSVVDDGESAVPVVRPVHRTRKITPIVEEEPEVPVRPVLRASKPAPIAQEEEEEFIAPVRPIGTPVRPVHRTRKIVPSAVVDEDEPAAPLRPVHRTRKTAPNFDEEVLISSQTTLHTQSLAGSPPEVSEVDPESPVEPSIKVKRKLPARGTTTTARAPLIDPMFVINPDAVVLEILSGAGAIPKRTTTTTESTEEAAGVEGEEVEPKITTTTEFVLSPDAIAGSILSGAGAVPSTTTKAPRKRVRPAQNGAETSPNRRTTTTTEAPSTLVRPEAAIGGILSGVGAVPPVTTPRGKPRQTSTAETDSVKAPNDAGNRRKQNPSPTGTTLAANAGRVKILQRVRRPTTTTTTVQPEEPVEYEYAG